MRSLRSSLHFLQDSFLHALFYLVQWLVDVLLQSNPHAAACTCYTGCCMGWYYTVYTGCYYALSLPFTLHALVEAAPVLHAVL